MKIFGISKFRDELGNHTARYIADKSSVSRTTICNWRNGKHFMRIDALLSVLDAIGKDIDDFVENNEFEKTRFRDELKKHKIKDIANNSFIKEMTVCNWKNGRNFIRVNDLLSVLAAIDKNIYDFLITTEGEDSGKSEGDKSRSAENSAKGDEA